MSEAMTGKVKVWVSNDGDACERRMHVMISGLPGWVLSMLADASPLVRSATSYDPRFTDDTGPSSVAFAVSKVFTTGDPATPTGSTDSNG